MHFIDDPFEQTTAATDVLLAVLAATFALSLWRLRQQDHWKATLWAAAFGALSLAASLGAVVHGFAMPEGIRLLLKQPLNLALGVMIALFVAGVTYEVWGRRASRWVLLGMLAAATLFVGIALLWPDTFLVFIIYQSGGMFFALAVYSWLAGRRRSPGASLLAVGVLITIIAGAIQASRSVSLELIWQFNHNGVFHLVQAVGIIFIWAGLHTSLRQYDSRRPTVSDHRQP
jgi:hypothetical protein